MAKTKKGHGNAVLLL